ncbi:MAG TPA: hypothetical protein VK250_10370 [Nitrososphaeraceae archaeon]|nr:hypothetical protein [Nitrososphaeraceae archaeon]
MIINFNIIFFSFLSYAFIFSIIFTNSVNLFDEIYGHGLSRDESLPFDFSGRQIAIEGILEPPFLNDDKKPTLIIRAHDEKTNQTVNDINYRIIAKFKNETIIDQRFHAIDGIVSANLIPSNSSLIHEILSSRIQEQQNVSKNELVKVSSENPITLKSKLLADGGLYDISVILEKSSKGLKLGSDKKVDLFISIGKNFPFVIDEVYSNDSSGNNNNFGNLTLIVKTFYDEIKDFVYDRDSSKISFKMPFTWDLNYVNQVVNLHKELVIPKDYTPLSKVSSFIGKLNGLEIPQNAILIDDFTDQNNRFVHIIVANFKLKEFTNNILKEGGDSYARFELEPIKK